MPTMYWRYNRETGASVYRTSCTRCRAFVEQDGHQRNARTEETFRWLNGPGRYNSRCRECERAVRAGRAGRPLTPRTERARTAAARIVRNDDRRFGVEIEARFNNGADRSQVQSALYRAGLHDWSVKSDCSIRGNGWEIVSPPISGEEGRRQVRVACAALREAGASVDSSCGLHIHHECRDLGHDALRRVARSWANNQTTIDGLVAPSRRGHPTYCEAFGSYEARMVEQASNPGRVSLSRYKALNFTSFPRYGTLEVRQHQGTLSAAKIIAWLDMGQALIHASATATQPVAEHRTMRDFLDALPSLAEDAAAFLLGRATQLGHVPVSA